MKVDTLNVERALDFSGQRVQARLVLNVRDFPIEGRAIVVNLGTEAASVVEQPLMIIPPMSASTLRDSRIAYADSLVVLRPDESATISEITTEPGWARYSDIVGHETPGGTFPPEIELWRSPLDHGPTVTFDPAAVLGGVPAGRGPQPFRVRLNLWFAPAGTACGIHNRHDFVETHVGVLGSGRVLRFRSTDPASWYEDVPLPPGAPAHRPFCVANAPDQQPAFVYPHHEYRADTDTVWLALEYHQV